MLSTNGVLSSAKPIKYVVFSVRNMSGINMLNKCGPSIELLGTLESIASIEP